MSQPYFVQYRLGGNLIDNPTERQDTSIQVQFDEGTQGSIETSQLTFVNEAYTIIKETVESGLITEGLPLTITIQEGEESTEVFNGYLDFSTLEDLTGSEPKFLASIVEQNGLTNLSESLEGVTFALLEAKGFITSSDYQDVKYLIEKLVTLLEQAFLALSIYLMIKEIAEASFRLSQQIAIISAIVTTPISGQIGALIYAVASALFEIAYIVIMGAALLDLIQQFIENLISFEREFQGIKFKTALEKIFSYLGYTFVSPIPELDTYVYLPSKAEGRADKGIPFDSDFGFVANEFVSMVLDMFRAEIFVVNNEVQLRAKKDPFFQSQSTFQLPDVLEQPFSLNINEIKESRFISFQDDISDAYTVSNWKGTSFVVTTLPITQNIPKNNLIKGLEETRFPVALGNRKEELSILEEALNTFFEAANFALSALGASNITNTIQARKGMLIISQPFFNVPKVLNMQGNRLAQNSRDGLSARYLWENYLNYDSFIEDNFKRQRKVFEGIEIPFSYSDYKKVKENSYFITSNGKRGKFTSLEWIIEADRAEASFWVEDVYTRNLQEETTEVS